MSEGQCELIVAPSARRKRAEDLSESEAFVAYEFASGALLENTHRWGQQLRRCDLLDRKLSSELRVVVVGVFSRADAYRPRWADISSARCPANVGR